MDDLLYTASREALLSRDYLDDLGEWLRRVPLSRKAFVAQATDVLYDFHDCGGRLFTGEGELIRITPGVFDDAHGECSEGEWISERRRRNGATRAPRKTLLGRLQLYDGVSIIAGRPIIPNRRRVEVAEMRHLLSRFNGVWKARYVNEMRKLRKAHDRETALLFGAAVRRLRLRFAAELDQPDADPRCPDCGRMIQPWPREREQWCQTCIDPNKLM